jgi:hypothetical protein
MTEIKYGRSEQESCPRTRHIAPLILCDPNAPKILVQRNPEGHLQTLGKMVPEEKEKIAQVMEVLGITEGRQFTLYPEAKSYEGERGTEYVFVNGLHAGNVEGFEWVSLTKFGSCVLPDGKEGSNLLREALSGWWHG